MEQIINNAPVVDFFSDLSEVEKAQADYLAHLALQIRDYRLKKGWTQQQMAAYLDVKQSMISKLESGDYNPTLRHVAALSVQLGFRLQLGNFVFGCNATGSEPNRALTAAAIASERYYTFTHSSPRPAYATV